MRSTPEHFCQNGPAALPLSFAFWACHLQSRMHCVICIFIGPVSSLGGPAVGEVLFAFGVAGAAGRRAAGGRAAGLGARGRGEGSEG